MNRKDVIKILQGDIKVPDLVQKKADAAFEVIQREAEENRRKPARRRGGKRFWVVMAAALLAIGTISAAADYIKRSRSLTEGMRVTEQETVQMKEKHLSELVNQTCTDQGITVTALQCITDHYYTHIAFLVEGFQVEAGVQPEFGTVKIMIDGNDGWNAKSPDDSFNYSGSFYNGLVPGEDGRAVKADGSPVQRDQDGNLIENYMMDDGSMEYQVTLSNTAKKGFFMNKPIHVELVGLGTVSRDGYKTSIEGIWTFDWTLSGSPEVRECDLNAPLGDSGATLVKAEISPISLAVEYEFPRQEITARIQDEHGNETEAVSYKEPPALWGVRMKDGTMYPSLYLGPGSSGYVSLDSDRYRTVFAIDRILDVDQVQGLLLAKEHVSGTSAEEMYYIIPVN